MMRLISTPREVEIAITTSCNLRCKYCFHFTSYSDVDTDLPAEEWLTFFKELNKYTVLSVTLGGGEPFLRKDTKEILKGIIKNDMRFSILTNGTLIKEDISVFLGSTNRLDFVQVSIDGSTSEIHDKVRGKGTFKSATEGIKLLLRYNVPVTVRVTINKYNLNDLEAISELLLSKLRLKNFSTNAASYMGMCRQNADEIQLDTDDRTKAMEILLRLYKKYNGRIKALAGPLAEATQWLRMEEARKKGLKNFPNGGRLTGCGGIFKSIAVRSDGVVIPCTQLAHIELGKINQDDLKEIWNEHPLLKELRERINISLREFDFCKDCPYIDYCTGGCPATAFNLTGSVFHPDPSSCLRLFLENGGRLPKIC